MYTCGRGDLCDSSPYTLCAIPTKPWLLSMGPSMRLQLWIVHKTHAGLCNLSLRAPCDLPFPGPLPHCTARRHLPRRVKSESAEAQLPEFDLAKKVGRKIALQKDRRALVLVVVDVWDFDGSLPRAALA